MSDTIQTTNNRKVKTKKTFLTSQEVSKLLEAAKKHSRYSTRDQALILLTFRHGLRATEATSLAWHQIDLAGAKFTVNRLKGSDDSVQVLEADEIKLLKKLKADQADNNFVFLTERSTPMNADGFLKLVKKLGKLAGIEGAHPHQLRHGAGHALAMNNASTRTIQAFLGHRNIQHTVLYTKMNDSAFRGFGKLIGGKL